MGPICPISMRVERSPNTVLLVRTIGGALKRVSWRRVESALAFQCEVDHRIPFGSFGHPTLAD